MLPPTRSLLLLSLLSLAFAKTSHAQGGGAGGTPLPGSEVRVEKLFDARLGEAVRVEVQPTLPAVDTAVAPQRYDVVPVDAQIDYDPPRIRPRAIRTEAPPPAYRGFARAGAGFAPGWIADLGYATNDEQKALRADAHTYGFAQGDADEPRYAEVDATLGGTYYRDQLAIDLDLDYERRMYRYYGFAAATRAPDTTRLPDELDDQYFGVFGIRAGVRNARPTTSGIDYHAGVGFQILDDNFANKQRDFTLAAGARRDFGADWWASLALDVDATTYENDGEQSLNNYLLTPTVGTKVGALGVRLGAVIANSDDAFRVFPDAELSYNLGGGFVVVAGADGGLTKNDYRRLTRFNPYLASDIEIRNAERWRGYLGVQGQTRGVTYAAKASYTRVNNIALFAFDPAAAYRFVPVYDTAGILGLHLTASTAITDRVTGLIAVDARDFSLDGADEPFGLPSFDARARASYEVVPDRFRVEGSVTFQNAPPFAAPTASEPGPIDPDDLTGALFDVSVHGTYAISERFGAFAQLNNLLNNRRERIPYYPILGANVLAGVTARF